MERWTIPDKELKKFNTLIRIDLKAISDSFRFQNESVANGMKPKASHRRDSSESMAVEVPNRPSRSPLRDVNDTTPVSLPKKRKTSGNTSRRSTSSQIDQARKAAQDRIKANEDLRIKNLRVSLHF